MAASTRLAHLDALRGLAALYVVIFHVMAAPQLAVPGWLTPAIGFGGTGVVLFFVMSAFSLCLTWPVHARTPMPRRHFYLKRAFRIAPLFLGLLTVMALLDAMRPARLFEWPQWLGTAALIFNVVPAWQQGIVGGGWTIGVEVIFYALFPFLATFVRGMRGALTLTTAAFVLWYFASRSTVPLLQTLTTPVGFLRHLPVFAVGCVGFALWNRRREDDVPQSRWRGRAVTVCALVGTGLLAYADLGADGFITRWYASSLLYMALLLGAGMAPDSWLVNRATVALGRISYSLYLTHAFVISKLFPVYASVYARELPAGFSFLICVSMTLLVALPVATLTYYIVERIGMKIGDWIIAHAMKRSLPYRTGSRPEPG